MERPVRLTSLALVATAALIGGPLLGADPWRWVAAGVLAATALVAWGRDESNAAALAAVGLVVVAAASRVVSSVWLAALAAAVVLAFRPHLRTRFAPWRGSSWDARTYAVMAATLVAATVALAIWAAAQPGFGAGTVVVLADEESALDRVIDQARDVPVLFFPLVAVAFATVNAVAEELVYRGVVMGTLLPAGVATAVGLQAATFAAIHLNGFPSGWWGVAMTAAYGLVLGWLRVRTGGLAAPVVVHFGADLVIAYLVRFGFG